MPRNLYTTRSRSVQSAPDRLRGFIQRAQLALGDYEAQGSVEGLR